MSPPSTVTIRIGVIVKMAAWTMQFARIGRIERRSSEKVLSMGDRLKMIRIHTTTDPTEMVELQPERDRADQIFVTHPMR